MIIALSINKGEKGREKKAGWRQEKDSMATNGQQQSTTGHNRKREARMSFPILQKLSDKIKNGDWSEVERVIVRMLRSVKFDVSGIR